MTPTNPFQVMPESAITLVEFQERPASVSPNRFPKSEQFFSVENLDSIAKSILKWATIAQTQNIDIEKPLKNLTQIIEDAPSIDNPRNYFEGIITLVQQITLRSMYCNQIIRKIMQSAIERTINQAKLTFKNEIVISSYEAELHYLIPHKISLRPIEEVEVLFNRAMLMLLEFQDVTNNGGEEITMQDLNGNCG